MPRLFPKNVTRTVDVASVLVNISAMSKRGSKRDGMGKMVRRYNSAAMARRSEAAKVASGAAECRECQCMIYPVNGVLPDRCGRCGAART